MAKKHVKSQAKPHRPTPTPMDRVAKLAVNGLYFGMGTAALVADNAQSFVKKAVARGQQVDLFENVGKLYTLQGKVSEKLADLPQQPLKFIRSLVPARKEKDQVLALEARLRDEVMKAAERIQTPLRKNLQDLTKKVNNLSNLVAKVAAR